MTEYAPIVLFVYNRLSKLKLVVESLKVNPESVNSELFIYSDGAKSELDSFEVQEVRNYVTELKGFKKVHLIFSETNVGLASNIVSGVTNVLAYYDYVIVLEDDIVVESNFLEYMNNALRFYQNCEEVAHISAYMYPIDYKTFSLPDFFFLNLATCWGWATYARSWKYLIMDVDLVMSELTPSLIKDFNLDDAYPFYDQLVGNKNGHIKTWAIFWYATLYREKFFSLHPKRTFVRNIGNDSTGVHSPNTKVFDSLEVSLVTSQFSSVVEYSVDARKAVIAYFEGIKRSLVSRAFSYLIKYIKF